MKILKASRLIVYFLHVLYFVHRLLILSFLHQSKILTHEILP
jgi:hypothetical protein